MYTFNIYIYIYIYILIVYNMLCCDFISRQFTCSKFCLKDKIFLCLDFGRVYYADTSLRFYIAE